MSHKAGLYIVATPIGNLEDISLRALHILKNADIIFCEDTRITNILLQKYHIKQTLKKYNDFSNIQTRKEILQDIKLGKIIALVSDAGTPMISDPGYKLVKYLQEQNIFIDSIPGPSALTTAITLSGIPSNNFYFYGFTDNKIKNTLEKIKYIDTSIIFFVSPKKLIRVMEQIKEIVGDREASIIREISKLYQESKRNNISQLIKYYNDNQIKGEIVLIVGPCKKIDEEYHKYNDTIKLLLTHKLSTQNICDAILGINPDINKKAIYKQVINIKNELTN